MDAVERLREFYSGNGISALHFNCPSRERCKAAVVRVGGTFVTASEVSIGERYFDSRPKIAVVSLDPGSQQSPEELRILKEPASNLELGPRNRHWYRTHEGVAAMVQGLTGTGITVNEAKVWFTHARVVRCCANIERRGQAPTEMFWSCRRYLEDEIEILAPDVIWTQGDDVYNAMSWVARHVEVCDLSLTLQGVRRIRTGNGSLTWVHTAHPSRRGCNWGEAMTILRSVRQQAESASS